MLIILLEVTVFAITAILSLLWIYHPNNNYEPWTVLACILGTGAVDVLRRFQNHKNQTLTAHTKNITRKESKLAELIAWIQNHGSEKPLSQVLPRALQLAQLANDHDFEHWIRMELYGYNSGRGYSGKRRCSRIPLCHWKIHRSIQSACLDWRSGFGLC